MQSRIDKRDRSGLFRERLLQAMQREGHSKSALARATGVDRSTIGQLLGSELPRLPNAQLAADADASQLPTSREARRNRATTDR